MQPLDAGQLSFVVASIVSNAAGVTSVDWSDTRGGTALATGSLFALPAGLVAPNQSVIVVQSQYIYQSSLGKLITGPITLTDRFFLAPRRSVKVSRI